MIIVTYNGKPIYATNNDYIDSWLAFKALVNELTNEGVKYWIERPLTDSDFDNWRGRNNFRGNTWDDLEKSYDLKVWGFSELNGFVEQ